MHIHAIQAYKVLAVCAMGSAAVVLEVGGFVCFFNHLAAFWTLEVEASAVEGVQFEVSDWD
jgi:hypothetical protein